MSEHMNSEIRIVIILSCAPLINLLLHMILARSFRNLSPQIVAIKSIFLGYILLFLLLWLFVFPTVIYLPSHIVTILVYCFLVYTLLSYTYFHFFNMSETARRIRILNEIYKAGSLPIQNMEVLYNTSDIVDLRLKRLIAMKQLRYEDGYYSLHGKILYIAGRVILWWRKVLGLNEK